MVSNQVLDKSPKKEEESMNQESAKMLEQLGSAGGEKAVTLEVNKNNVAVVTVNLPGSEVNLLSSKVLAELNVAIEKIALMPQLKGAIFISGKKDNFFAGADVKEIQKLQSEQEIFAKQASDMGKVVFDKLEKLPIRVVAAINGVCVGGGMEFALACHYRIATSSKKTMLGLPEVKLGFIPGWGANYRLAKLIGLQNALQIIPAGQIVPAKKAWKFGMIDEVVEPASLLERAEEVVLTGRVKRAKQPFKAMAMKMLMEGNPLGRHFLGDMALKMTKRQTKGKFPAPVEAVKIIMKTATDTKEKSFARESNAFAALAATDVSKNLVGIFFAQNESKTTPNKMKPSIKVQTFGVLGTGVMGAGIAQAAAKAGYKVVIKDVNEEFLAKGMATIRGLFETLVERRKMTQEEMDACLKSITTTTSYEPFSECDMVLEAVKEDLAVKKSVLADLEKAIKKPFIFATNTSSLSVTAMAEGARNPELVVGVHFFNPVHKMPLVEIVRGKQTSDEAVAAAMIFAMKLGKTTVVTGDSAGFVVNRILTPYLREAIVLLEEGVAPADIEKAMKDFGMPMGPLTLMDEVGLDIGAKVVDVLHEAFGDRLKPPAILASLAGLKLLGKKGGKGLYLYDATGKRGEFNPEILAAVKAKPVKKDKTEIQNRMVLLMLNEAVKCLEEGVITDPAQLDLAMIFGTGFPPFRGGILRYADQTGVKVVADSLQSLSQVAGENYKPAKMLLSKAEKGENFYKS